MLRTAAKPKLSLSINTQAISAASKPQLALNTAAASPFSTASLASPTTACRSPCSPMPASPTVLNTSLNRRAASTMPFLQVPTYNYVNTSTVKSILKKDPSPSSSKSGKRLQINLHPTAVHAVTPIDDVDYWYKPVGRW
jgi:hypothetical protein